MADKKINNSQEQENKKKKKGFAAWWHNLGKGGQIAICALLGAGVATAVVVPTVIAINKNKSNTPTVEIDDSVKSSVTAKDVKYNGDNLEMTLVNSDAKKEFSGDIKITIGNYELITGDYTFDKSSGKLTIKKSVIDANKGSQIIVNPTLKNKEESTSVTEGEWEKAFEYLISEDRNYSGNVTVENSQFDIKVNKNVKYAHGYDEKQKLIEFYRTKLNDNLYVEQTANGKVDDITNICAIENVICQYALGYKDNYTYFKDSYNENTGEYSQSYSSEIEKGVTISGNITIKFIKSNGEIYLKLLKIHSETSEPGKTTKVDYDNSFFDYKETVLNVPEATNLVINPTKSSGSYIFDSRKYDSNNNKYLYKIDIKDKFEDNKYLKITLNDNSGKATTYLGEVVFAINGSISDIPGTISEPGALYIPNSAFKSEVTNELYLLNSCTDGTNSDLKCTITLNAEKQTTKTIGIDRFSVEQCLLNLNLIFYSVTPEITTDYPMMLINYNNSTGNEIIGTFNVKSNNKQQVVGVVQFTFKTNGEPVSFDMTEIINNVDNNDLLIFENNK